MTTHYKTIRNAFPLDGWHLQPKVVGALRGMGNRTHKLEDELEGATDFPAPGCPLPAPAFTLVEMLIVMLIVAIGFLLVVGVGSTVQEDARARETRHTQAVLLAALQAYHDVHAVYPPGDGGPGSTVGLLRALRSEPACKTALDLLPAQAVDDESGRPCLLDGFASPLLYEPTGGLGGKRPRLVSKGNDPVDSTDDIVSE